MAPTNSNVVDRGVLAIRAEMKTASLLQNPLRGGIPDREAVAIAIRINVMGIYFFKPPMLNV
jgi:hypothetical protein